MISVWLYRRVGLTRYQRIVWLAAVPRAGDKIETIGGVLLTVQDVVFKEIWMGGPGTVRPAVEVYFVPEQEGVEVQEGWHLAHD